MQLKFNNRRIATAQTSRDRILEALQTSQQLSRDELVRVTGLTYDTIRNQCSNLVSQGKIHWSERDHGRRIYSLQKLAVLGVAILSGWGIDPIVSTFYLSGANDGKTELAAHHPGGHLPQWYSQAQAGPA